jgi:pimeloyl-ACP methyl ester carboxylesterase
MPVTSLVLIIAIPVFLLGLFVCLILVAWRGAGQLIHPPHTHPQASPQAYGLAAEAIAFQNHAGLTLRGWFIPAPRAKGTIVFSHGYASDCTPDLIYAPLFFQAAFNTLFFDYRGHGASDGNTTSLVYFERDDLSCALDFLHGRGIDKVGLIGFSMGGAIALATAPSSPTVVGVISDCAFANLRTVVTQAAINRGYPVWTSVPLGWLVVALACLRLRVNLFAADPIHWVQHISPRPLLIMHGGQDPDAPVDQARRLFDAAREPKQLWIVPTAGHRKIEEIARDEYRQRLVEFFDHIFDLMH